MKHAVYSIACVCLVLPVGGIAGEVKFLGRAACATSTCHGGVTGQGPQWNHSLSTWFAQDPHRGAGLLLRDEDSRAIVQRLNPAAAGSAEVFDTVLRSRCISCHSTATSDDCVQAGLLDDVFLAQGVSCESCHGAAGVWLRPHLQVEWSGPQRFEAETGMLDTESIMGRAETCVRCHVGSRTSDGLVRDVNHDLIAAGHPALRFDLLVYNENLPKHWDQNSDVEATFGESAIRVRSVSRAVNLAAAASLSSQRANDHLKDRSVPWPELADYDCFGCHQSLSMREYRLPVTDQKKSPLHISDGLPIWNAWHTINQLELRDNPDLLEKLSPHRSDPKQIATSGITLADRYRRIAASRASQRFVAQEMLKLPLQQLQAQPSIDWHQAAIQYLEIDAALRDLARDPATAQKGKQLLESLRKSEQLLRFDPTRSEGQRAAYHSPATFNSEAFRAAVLGVFNVQPVKKQ